MFRLLNLRRRLVEKISMARRSRHRSQRKIDAFAGQAFLAIATFTALSTFATLSRGGEISPRFDLEAREVSPELAAEVVEMANRVVASTGQAPCEATAAPLQSREEDALLARTCSPSNHAAIERAQSSGTDFLSRAYLKAETQIAQDGIPKAVLDTCKQRRTQFETWGAPYRSLFDNYRQATLADTKTEPTTAPPRAPEQDAGFVDRLLTLDQESEEHLAAMIRQYLALAAQDAPLGQIRDKLYKTFSGQFIMMYLGDFASSAGSPLMRPEAYKDFQTVQGSRTLVARGILEGANKSVHWKQSVNPTDFLLFSGAESRANYDWWTGPDRAQGDPRSLLFYQSRTWAEKLVQQKSANPDCGAKTTPESYSATQAECRCRAQGLATTLLTEPAKVSLAADIKAANEMLAKNYKKMIRSSHLSRTAQEAVLRAHPAPVVLVTDGAFSSESAGFTDEGASVMNVSVASLLTLRNSGSAEASLAQTILNHELGHLFFDSINDPRIQGPFLKSDIQSLEGFRDCLDQTIVRSEFDFALRSLDPNSPSFKSLASDLGTTAATPLIARKRPELAADYFAARLNAVTGGRPHAINSAFACGNPREGETDDDGSAMSELESRRETLTRTALDPHASLEVRTGVLARVPHKIFGRREVALPIAPPERCERGLW